MIDSPEQRDSGEKTLRARPGLLSNRADKQARLLQLSAAAGLVVGLLICTASAASAATTTKSKGRVTFGVAPASPLGADGRPDFSFGVTPGATLHDHVAVLNYSSIPLSLHLYATDAIETSGGGFGLLPAATRPTGAGSWISVPLRFATVRVPAESAKGPGQVVVPLLVKVPDNAMPGDHAGGIVASLQTVGTNASGENIILVQRVGTRVFIRVTGTLAPKLSVADLHATYHGTPNPVGQGQVTVSYLVSNTGNVDLALNQSVSLSGLLGTQRQLALAKVPLLLPGASLQENIVVPGVWPQFFLRAVVSARPLAPAGGHVPGLAPLTATTSLWAIPWPVLPPLALVLLAVLVAYRARARGAARHHARKPQVVSA